jgi:hypothetical protein
VRALWVMVLLPVTIAAIYFSPFKIREPLDSRAIPRKKVFASVESKSEHPQSTGEKDLAEDVNEPRHLMLITHIMLRIL